MSLFVMLVLLLTAVTGEDIPSFTVREGDEVTLPCGNVIECQQNCDGTSWLISQGFVGALELVTRGNISEKAVDLSNRLRVVANCSLVITEVSMLYVGRYACRQFKSGEQHGQDAHVDLSVLEIGELLSKDESSFSCSVDTYDNGCWHTVQWLYTGSMNDMVTSQATCSATVTFRTPPLDQALDFGELLICTVTDSKSGQTLLSNVGSQSSRKNTASTSPGREDEAPMKPGYLKFIIFCVGLAALITIVVVVNIWVRTEGKKETQMDDADDAVQNDDGGDDDDDAVFYENSGGRDASVRLELVTTSGSTST
ncbi:uncharacterized protein [Labrus bergylta]|uniref:uncharacterized protein isoform X2 n=1 Tax=Labrus bergylta TaxID=56723 RepID=UPI00331369EA